MKELLYIILVVVACIAVQAVAPSIAPSSEKPHADQVLAKKDRKMNKKLHQKKKDNILAVWLILIGIVAIGVGAIAVLIGLIIGKVSLWMLLTLLGGLISTIIGISQCSTGLH